MADDAKRPRVTLIAKADATENDRLRPPRLLEAPKPPRPPRPTKRPAPPAENGEPKRKAANALRVGVVKPKPPPKPLPSKPKAEEVKEVKEVKPLAVRAEPPVAPLAAPPLSAAHFMVGGQTFFVAPKLVRSKPDTLLAKLPGQGDLRSPCLRLIAKAHDLTRPLQVPVDICPEPGPGVSRAAWPQERFRILLDWYRYNEIWVPSSIAVRAVLRDAGRAVAKALQRAPPEASSCPKSSW